MLIEQLWRYPVKSIGGEQVASSLVTNLGLEGDLRWGIRDNNSGMFLTARREPRLLEATAHLDGSDGVSLRTSDGMEITEDAALSRWLERDVRRFRSNIVFTGGDERVLGNKTVRAETVELAVQASIPRCVMVTRPQPGIERDLSVFKTIQHVWDGHLSVGALVSVAGEMAVGQTMNVLSANNSKPPGL